MKGTKAPEYYCFVNYSPDPFRLWNNPGAEAVILTIGVYPDVE
ncbi:hypothetical protein P0136_03395 [Lentisphaerota bacterium ZTH]|nr:hypothetical protein P0136_03395 [Lentisphaerota bacterium ZTH]